MRGGGVCFYVNQGYCNNTIVREAKCTPDIELLSISFLSATGVSSPKANAGAATQLIVDYHTNWTLICSEAPEFCLGDLNRVRLDGVLRRYEQHVSCLTTQKNTVLDVCYRNVKGGYRFICLPTLGAS